jgi:phosphoserine phosphatase
MTWACAGWARSEVEAFADQVIAKIDLASRLHPEATRVARWASGAGIDVVVVSASPRVIIERAVRLVGVPSERVVAATPRWSDGRMLAAVERPIPYGDGKVHNLRALVPAARPLFAAFGDNAFDVPLLAQAFIPVAVRPKPRLRERAHEVKTLVEIARES